jgi:DNA (cytosine-5)-methyltransferase 1
MRNCAQIGIDDEIFVDSFAGGGGASTGMEVGLGITVAAAINHDPAAILMHKTNHPYTEHYQASVWDVDPRDVCRGRPVGGAWFSPDCKHFSKAKGAALVDKKIRGLAWITLRWAALVRPRVIFLENVEEFQTWGPVRKGKPVKKLAGTTFRKFIGQLRDLGYEVEWRELVAADYGAPTSRKRFVLIARCDGKPIVWPEPRSAGQRSREERRAETVAQRGGNHRLEPTLPVHLRHQGGNQGAVQFEGGAAFGGQHHAANHPRRG